MFFRAPSNIEQLDFVMRKQQEMKVQARTRMIEEELRKTFHPFVELPIATQWSRQYDLVLGRYNFLVLDGDSRFGKNQIRIQSVAYPPYVLLRLHERSAGFEKLRFGEIFCYCAG